jgi:hypothetical protein
MYAVILSGEYDALRDKVYVGKLVITDLTPILLTWRIWWAPNNASKWQMGFNSAFKGLTINLLSLSILVHFDGKQLRVLNHLVDKAI